MNHQTVFFKKPVYIRDTSSTVGPKEAEGPLAKYFDRRLGDDLLNQKSYELAESKMMEQNLRHLLSKSGIEARDIDACFLGDLLDELMACNYAMKELDIPFIGVYNACASFGAALYIGATSIEAGYMKKVICATSSHFSSAERQYRYPLELGNQRTPLSQWTVTATGAVLLDEHSGNVRVESATIGKVVDFGVTDANDMGGAMAPSACDTLKAHFAGTKRDPSYYDAIFTGDLGEAGSRVLKKLMRDVGYDMEENYHDCGGLIFNNAAQKVEQGGSGAGCSSSVFAGYIYKKMLEGEYKRVLLAPTGALVSKVSNLQGQTIPAITHAVSFERL